MPIKILIIMVVLAIPLIPTFWAILDIPKRQFNNTKQKLIWFFTVSTLPCIGAVLYIFIGRRRTVPLEAACVARPGREEASQN
jgi:hypothetical protein